MIEELESLQEVHSDLPAKAFIKAVGEQRAGMEGEWKTGEDKTRREGVKWKRGGSELQK